MRNGERVRVEFEGIVEGRLPFAGKAFVRLRRDNGQVIFMDTDYVTVIEPEYEPHEFYVDAEGVTYRRTSTGSWFSCDGGPGFGIHRAHEVPVRPLRKLVPEITVTLEG